MRRVSTSVLVLLALVAGCTRSPSGADDDVARLIPLSGAVTVLRGGEQILATEEVRLAAGDIVSTGAGAAARLILPGEQSLELAPGTKAQMEPGPAPRLLQGNLLGVAGEGLSVLAGDERIQARDAIFRVQKTFSTTVGVYDGSVAVVDQAIPALRRLTIVSGSNLPQGIQPLLVRPQDPWDARFLGRAIDVGLGIQRLERGLSAQLGGPRGTAVVTDRLDKTYARALVRSLLETVERSQLADLVVAGELAATAAELTGTAPDSVLGQMLELRRQGAQWIVIVAQWRLFSERLLDALATLTRLIARALAPASVGGGVGPATGPAGTPSAGPGPGTPGDGPVAPGDPGDNNGNGTNGDPPPPPPPPPPECENAVECVVEDLLDTADAL